MFTEVKPTKQVKNIIKKIGMQNMDYNGYDQNFGIMYFTRKFEDNYLLGTYMLTEPTRGKYIPSYGSSVNLIDKFMADYLAGKELPLKELNKTAGNVYKKTLPTAVKEDAIIKNFKTNGFKILYVRDTSKLEKMPLKSIDVYLVLENDNYVNFKGVHFVKSMKSKKYINTNISDVVVPKFIINK